MSGAVVPLSPCLCGPASVTFHNNEQSMRSCAIIINIDNILFFAH